MTIFNPRHRSLLSQMNVVPYIDVMLVLLVIFMVTTPLFSPSAIHVPRVDQTGATQQTIKPIEIAITANGQVQLISHSGKKRWLAIADPNTFETIKMWASHLHNPMQPIAISADKNQRYNDVLQIVAALHAGGAKKVALTVDKKTSPHS
ncbi:MAG: biopolymer transporter ExbD [Neisseriales bacterium]|nr:MAG: biopolymer transporter ExbD [Neisseriales bacterium]